MRSERLRKIISEFEIEFELFFYSSYIFSRTWLLKINKIITRLQLKRDKKRER